MKMTCHLNNTMLIGAVLSCVFAEPPHQRTLSADEVTSVGSQLQPVRRTGTIVDYSAGVLTLKTVGGRQTKIPHASITSLSAEWQETHQQADAEFARGQDQAALKLYTQAFRDEQRRWVKMRLLGQAVRCQANLGRWAEAGRNFLRLTAADAETPYFAVIPLCWLPQPPPADVVAAARKWIRDTSAPARLLGASWLLTSPTDRRAALDMLRNLRTDANSQVAHLAVAQVWRAELVTVKPHQLAVWHQRLQEIPNDLQAGPCVALGLAYERAGQADQAALSLLRVPLLHAQHRVLAVFATERAEQILRRSGNDADADRVRRLVTAPQ